MRKSRWILTCLLAVALGSASWAGGGRPLRYLSKQDGRLSVAVTPGEGHSWAAWSYRQGAEFDLAISSFGTDGWSEPTFIGVDDGLQQFDPTLVTDAAGRIFVAYAQSDGTIQVIVRRPETGWSAPVALTPPGINAASPKLHLVGDRLVVAYVVRGGIELIDLAPATVGIQADGAVGGQGVQDTPDPVTTTPPQDEALKNEAESRDNPELPGDDDDDIFTIHRPKKKTH